MQEENEARAEAAELEVDELKSQLADYQQALDVQQTRAIQYNQALQALQRAKELCHLPDLTPESADEWLDTFQAKEQEATEKLLSLDQKMSVAQTAHSQFEQAYQLVVAINGPLARNEAWDVARELLRDGVNQRHLAEQVQPLRMRLNELEQRLREQQEAERLLAEFCKRQGKNYDFDELEALHQELEARIAALSDTVSNASEQRMTLRQELEQLQSRSKTLLQRAPIWLAAQSSLNQLSEQCGQEFASSQDVTEYMQQLLEREREAIVERDEVGARKRDVDEEIERLSQPGGSEDPRLNALAERFGGVLLSEIYDDVGLDDAPYFSALYGPSRNAIVVPDLSLISDQLAGLEDCPEDLYLIEGDPQSFDDSVFSVDELEKAVVVKIADRQWRYSRFPELPLFGAPRVKTVLKACTPSVKRFQSVLRPCRLTCRKPSVCIRRSAALSAAIWALPSSPIRKPKFVSSTPAAVSWSVRLPAMKMTTSKAACSLSRRKRALRPLTASCRA